MSTPTPFPGGAFGYPIVIDANALAGAASNVVTSDNPAYIAEDFYNFYPQFEGLIANQIILAQFLAMADAAVAEERWGVQWMMGMSLFIAHFVTLYLESVGTASNATASSVVAAARAKGLQTSKSAGDVSVSYDFSGVDFEGWPQWKTTIFGRQFASIARLLGKAGMYVR